MAHIHLEVVTPERKVFEANVDRVEVPGLDGELGILPGHTELVSQLKPAGLLTYHIGEDRGQISISDGFVEVTSNGVVVLADRAARPEDIDMKKALARKEQAEQQFARAQRDPGIDPLQAAADLERATIESNLASGLQK
ncbi:MAG: ATP synthase F1 subunit epsilon [Blastocatellia bacterium]